MKEGSAEPRGRGIASGVIPGARNLAERRVTAGGPPRGTRCACEEIHGVHFNPDRPNAEPLKRCPNDATRYVEVERIEERSGTEGTVAICVPVCEPCYRWHEAQEAQGRAAK